jgi:Cadherin-like/Putative Ig domain
VQFIQDGSATTPTYQVGVSDPYFTLSPASTVTTTFYRQPFITINQLLIHQGETVVMTGSQLSGIDDYPPAQVIFTMNQIQSGKFQLLPSNSTIQEFTQEQLTAQKILFVQDGSSETPSYRVGISDPYFDIPMMSQVITTFYRRPSFIHNQLQILEGQTVLMTANELSLQDDYPDTQVLFIISDCQNGQFELIPARNATTIQFTQQQINARQIQFVHNNKPVAPGYQVTASDGYFTLGPVSSTINFTLVDKPPALLNPIPPETFAIGEAFNFQIAADTFYDEQGKPIRLSSALADGLPLPKEITFDSPTVTFTGLVNSPENYNVSVSGTSVAELTTTTFFMLQISGQTSTSPLIDIKTLASIAGSIAGIALTVLSYLYTKYHFRKKREFEHPFANALHQRLNLSYLDFFDKDGKEYATLVDRMMAFVKTKNGVDIESLQNSQRPVDQTLYRRYADVFATTIARQIRTNSVYCGCSRELHLRGLNTKSESIVNEVIRQISQQPGDDKDTRSIGSCWGRLFCCRRSSVQNDAQDEAKIPRSNSASVSLNQVSSSVNANNTDSLTTALLS